MTSNEQQNIFTTNLNYYVGISGKSQKEIADKIGVSPQTFNTWVKGIAIPRMGKIQALADYFHINKSDLIDEHNQDSSELHSDNIRPISLKKFPLLGEIACGEPILANEVRESYVVAGTDIKADFCLIAKGDSMIGARILDGDIIFIQKTDIVNNGEIAAVIIDDEVLLKRFYYFREEQVLTLVSENPQYPPMNFTNEQLDHIRVLGKAVAFQSDVI